MKNISQADGGGMGNNYDLIDEFDLSHRRDLVRLKMATKFFGISESFLRHALLDGSISGYKLKGAVFVSISEIENQIKRGKFNAKTD